MKTEDVEKHLMGLTLSSKPLSESTFMKGIALILAGMEAQRTGKLDPDHFEEFVVSYCLRASDSEEFDTCQERSAVDAVKAKAWVEGVYSPWRARILQRSQEAYELNGRN